MLRHSERGVSLLELVFAAALASTVAAVSVPSLRRLMDEARALGAARYVAGRLREARMEAVKRSANTAMLFAVGPDGHSYSVHLDGNGDGVRQQDVDRGIDPALRGPERLPAHFPGVDFGAGEGVPAPDAGSTPPGSDPIRIGNTNLLTFTPLGTATPGSLYLRGSGGTQYVVRVFGETGRVRILAFQPVTGRWRGL
jgi:type II secretory pathway pseudopilin PulG